MGGVVVSLPDSLEAGRGEAMPWGRAEAAERGGGLSLSPTVDWTEQSKAETAEVIKDFTCGPAAGIADLGRHAIPHGDVVLSLNTASAELAHEYFVLMKGRVCWK